jgi:hypothetical protein
MQEKATDYLTDIFYVPGADVARNNVREHYNKIKEVSILISKRIADTSLNGKSKVAVPEVFDLGQEAVEAITDYLHGKKYIVKVYWAENDHNKIGEARDNEMTISW